MEKNKNTTLDEGFEEVTLDEGFVDVTEKKKSIPTSLISSKESGSDGLSTSQTAKPADTKQTAPGVEDFTVPESKLKEPKEVLPLEAKFGIDLTKTNIAKQDQLKQQNPEILNELRKEKIQAASKGKPVEKLTPEEKEKLKTEESKNLPERLVSYGQTLGKAEADLGVGLLEAAGIGLEKYTEWTQPGYKANPDENPLVKLGKGTRDLYDQIFPLAKKYQDDFDSEMVGMIPTLASFWGIGELNLLKLGKLAPESATFWKQALNTTAEQIPPSLAISTGRAVSEHDIAKTKSDEAKSMNFDEFVKKYPDTDGKEYTELKNRPSADVGWDAFKWNLIGGTLSWAIPTHLSLAAGLEKLDKLTGGNIKNAVTETAVGGLTGMVQMGLQEYLSNKTAQETYDFARDSFKNVASVGTSGFAINFFMEGVKNVLHLMGKTQANSEDKAKINDAISEVDKQQKEVADLLPNEPFKTEPEKPVTVGEQPTEEVTKMAQELTDNGVKIEGLTDEQVKAEYEKIKEPTVTPTEQLKIDISEDKKIAVDYHETIIDTKTDELTDLGKEVSANKDNENIVIKTAAEYTPELSKEIQDKTGFPEERILFDQKPEMKPEGVDVVYDDKKVNIKAAEEQGKETVETKPVEPEMTVEELKIKRDELLYQFEIEDKTELKPEIEELDKQIQKLEEKPVKSSGAQLGEEIPIEKLNTAQEIHAEWKAEKDKLETEALTDWQEALQRKSLKFTEKSYLAVSSNENPESMKSWLDEKGVDLENWASDNNVTPEEVRAFMEENINRDYIKKTSPRLNELVNKYRNLFKDSVKNFKPEKEEQYISPKNAATEATAKEQGITLGEKKKIKTPEQISKEAKKRIDRGEDSNSILEKIKKGDTRFDAVDQRILMDTQDRLLFEIGNLKKEYTDTEVFGGERSLFQIALENERKTNERSNILNAIVDIGTFWSELGIDRQKWLKRTFNFDVFKSQVEGLGKKWTPDELTELKTDFEKYHDAQQEISDLKNAILNDVDINNRTDLQALIEREVNRRLAALKKEGRTGSSKVTLLKEKASVRLESNRKAISNLLKRTGEQANVGIPIENMVDFIRVVGEMARDYVTLESLKAADVVNRIISDFKGHGLSLTEKEVVDAILQKGEFSKPKVEKAVSDYVKVKKELELTRRAEKEYEAEIDKQKRLKEEREQAALSEVERFKGKQAEKGHEEQLKHEAELKKAKKQAEKIRENEKLQAENEVEKIRLEEEKKAIQQTIKDIEKEKLQSEKDRLEKQKAKADLRTKAENEKLQAENEVEKIRLEEETKRQKAALRETEKELRKNKKEKEQLRDAKLELTEAEYGVFKTIEKKGDNLRNDIKKLKEETTKLISEKLDRRTTKERRSEIDSEIAELTKEVADKKTEIEKLKGESEELTKIKNKIKELKKSDPEYNEQKHIERLNDQLIKKEATYNLDGKDILTEKQQLSYELEQLQNEKTKDPKRIEEIKKRISEIDNRLKPQLSNRLFKKQTEAKLLQRKIEQKREKFIYDQKATYIHFWDKAEKLIRTNVLSGVMNIIPKLASNAMYRYIITNVDEFIGMGVSGLLKQEAANAPRQGGGSLKQLGKYSKKVGSETYDPIKSIYDPDTYFAETGFGKKLLKGESDIDVMFKGDKDIKWEVPVLKYFKNLHGAVKNAVQVGEFTLSYNKRIAFELKKQGINWEKLSGDQLTKTIEEKISAQKLQEIGEKAYLDSEDAILQAKDTKATQLVPKIKKFLQEPNKETKKPVPLSYAMGSILGMIAPVNTAPVNFIARGLTRSFGLLEGIMSASYHKYERFKGKEVSEKASERTLKAIKEGTPAALLATGIILFSRKEDIDVDEKGKLLIDGKEVKGLFKNLIHVDITAPIMFAIGFRNWLRSNNKDFADLTDNLYHTAKEIVKETPYVKELAGWFEPYRDKKDLAYRHASKIIPQIVKEFGKLGDYAVGDQDKIKYPKGFMESLLLQYLPVTRQKMVESVKDYKELKVIKQQDKAIEEIRNNPKLTGKEKGERIENIKKMQREQKKSPVQSKMPKQR